MALRDHLRAHQNIDRALVEGLEQSLKVALSAYRVTIHSRNAGFGKLAMQLILHFFRSDAEKLHVLASAFRADGRDLFGIVAVVAEHAPIAAVVGERDRAVHAGDTLSAGAARNKARESAAVQQQHNLLADLEALGHRL